MSGVPTPYYVVDAKRKSLPSRKLELRTPVIVKPGRKAPAGHIKESVTSDLMKVPRNWQSSWSASGLLFIEYIAGREF